jgi:hypothetical protein
MAEFYQRRVGPEFSDTSAAPRAALAAMTDVVGAIENFRKAQKADEKILLQTQYQNAATRAAIAAYQAHPDDLGAYDREFAKNLRESAPAVPLAETGTYGAIADRTRERYYWTIAANRGAALKKSLKENYLGEFLSKRDAGFGLMKGQLLEPDQTAAIGENFAGAIAALGATSADGMQLFTEEEIAEHVAGLSYGALAAKLDKDIGPEMPLEAVFQLADPNFNYTVTVGADGVAPLVFSKNSLPPELQTKFSAESVQKLGAFLKNQNDLAAVEHFASIYNGLESYIPGDGADKMAGELYARVQMERTPFTAESIAVHGNNIRWYLQTCGFLPKVYADKLATLCISDNPLAATIGATLIDGAISANPAAAEALDDEVVTRAFLIFSQIQGGTPADVAVTRAAQTMDRALNEDRDAIKRALEAKKSGEDSKTSAAAKFYGGAVTADEYGYGGVEFFRSKVDANFLLNGGNRDLAVKLAKAATDARYTKTNVGFYDGLGKRVANAPESVYGPRSAPYINQLLTSHRQEITQKTGMSFDVNRLKLVATPDTERQIQTGERPEWLLLRVNDDGHRDFYINRETGRPLTFSLPEGFGAAWAKLSMEESLLLKVAQAAAASQFTVGQFFQKIWSRKREVDDAR